LLYYVSLAKSYAKVYFIVIRLYSFVFLIDCKKGLTTVATDAQLALKYSWTAQMWQTTWQYNFRKWFAVWPENV